MPETERAWETIAASLADDPSVGRLVGRRAAVLAWSRDGGRLLWASPAAAGSEPPAGRTRERLAELGDGLAPREGFRLERLRLRPGDGPDSAYACRRVEAAGEEALVTAAVSLGPDPGGEPGREAPDAAAAADGASKLRFTWSTDADGRIAAVSPALAKAVGPERAAVLGRRWEELGRDGPVAAGADRVAAAAASGEAWSGLVVLWRSGPGNAALPVEIAGAPSRAEPGAHQGFGVAWTGRVVELPDDEEPPPRPAPRLVAAEPAPRAAAAAPAEPATATPTLPPQAASPPPAAERDQSGPTPPEPEEASPRACLSPAEQGALQEIARALGARLEPSEPAQAFDAGPAPPPAPPPPPPEPRRPPAEPAEPAADAPEREAFAQAALAVAADGAAALDGAGLITALDGGAERLFGRSARDVEGADLAALLHPDDHRAALDGLRAARAGGRGEALVRARGGDGASLLMRAGPGGDPGGLVATFLDVSRLKKAADDSAAARRAAERARAGQVEFLARVSHEIRTPLTAIVGFAELMAAERFGPLGSERYHGYVGDIREAGGHALSLVNDLLDLAKATSGAGDLRREPVDLNAVVRGAVATLGPLAMRERVILRASLGEGLPPAMADERSLRQITLNVLSNAIRFSGAGGQAIVSTGRGEGGAVALRVRDTGPGMGPEEIEAALTPFRQLTSSRREDGTGLGLPLSKALAEANGGAFALASERGAGALVEVRLPSAAVRERPAA